MIECFKCNNKEFKFSTVYVYGLAHMHCTNCFQGHIFIEKGVVKAVHAVTDFNSKETSEERNCPTCRVTVIAPKGFLETFFMDGECLHCSMLEDFEGYDPEN